MDRAVHFWDKIAEKYSKQPVADEDAYQKKLAKTRSYLKPDMNVLEFGCGTGSTALVHAPFVNQIRAIDISSKMIEIAKKKAELADVKNINFEVATLEDLDITGKDKEAYDVIMGHSILHLVEDRDAAISQVAKMLKPGGYFITSTACIDDSLILGLILRIVLPLGYLLGLLPKVRFFNTKKLMKSFDTGHFTVECMWHAGKHKTPFVILRKK